MEVDKSAEQEEQLLLGDDGGEAGESSEFTIGDVELLLGDDDVNAFANESFDEAEVKEATEEGKNSNNSGDNAAENDKNKETGQQIEGHYNRGRGRPHNLFGRGRGGYPPFFPRGLRPPFPGAVPRFPRHPPPFAFRGRPPMFGMRYPRGVFMRSSRPNFAPEEEEDEDEDEEMTEEKSEEGSGGPKPLMSIRTPKDIKESVKSQLRGKGPQLMVPLGMGMGPRFHGMRGMRPPLHPPPQMHEQQPPPLQSQPQQPPLPHPQSSSSYRGSTQHHHPRGGSLKRPSSSSNAGGYQEGPRPKMMAPLNMDMPPPSQQPQQLARSNLRQIQTVDEPMNQAPPSRPHYHQPRHQQPSFQRPPPQMATASPFVVSHKPAPSLTTIRTVDSTPSRPSASQQQPKSNLRTVPIVGASNPTPPPKITKAGGTSSRVMISNLPATMSFERISAMTTACGNVRTINVNENGTAIVEFTNPGGVENFIRANNRKIIDRSMISVARLA